MQRTLQRSGHRARGIEDTDRIEAKANKNWRLKTEPVRTGLNVTRVCQLRTETESLGLQQDVMELVLNVCRLDSIFSRVHATI